MLRSTFSAEPVAGTTPCRTRRRTESHNRTNLSFWCWVFFEFSLGIFFVLGCLNSCACLSLALRTCPVCQAPVASHKKNTRQNLQNIFGATMMFRAFFWIFGAFLFCNFRKSGLRSRLANFFHRQKPPAKLHLPKVGFF